MKKNSIKKNDKEQKKPVESTKATVKARVAPKKPIKVDKKVAKKGKPSVTFKKVMKPIKPSSESKKPIAKKVQAVKKVAVRQTKSRKARQKESLTNDAMQKSYAETLEKYGKLLEEQINTNRCKDKALGQFLMGLYLLGMGPDKVLEKCQQMFEPVKQEGDA